MNTEGVSVPPHDSKFPNPSVEDVLEIASRLSAKPWVERILIWPELETGCAYWNRSLVVRPDIFETVPQIVVGRTEEQRVWALPVLFLPEDDAELARDLAIAQRTALLSRITGWWHDE